MHCVVTAERMSNPTGCFCWSHPRMWWTYRLKNISWRRHGGLKICEMCVHVKVWRAHGARSGTQFDGLATAAGACNMHAIWCVHAWRLMKTGVRAGLVLLCPGRRPFCDCDCASTKLRLNHFGNKFNFAFGQFLEMFSKFEDICKFCRYLQNLQISWKICKMWNLTHRSANFADFWTLQISAKNNRFWKSGTAAGTAAAAVGRQ